ncbi:MAG: hypothetical protein ACK5O1_04640, partial [Holosporales bacterium]
NTNDLNPVSIGFDENSEKFSITYYDPTQQYGILITDDLMISSDQYVMPLSDARKLYRDKTITLPQGKEKEVEAGPETGTGTGTEEVKPQSSSPSEEKNVGQDDKQSEEPEINTAESEPPSTPQPPATLETNLEALLKQAESSEEDHYQRLAAAIEFILSNSDAMEELAGGETILVVDHEGKNPVSVNLNPDNGLECTVHYPKGLTNYFIELNEDGEVFYNDTLEKPWYKIQELVGIVAPNNVLDSQDIINDSDIWDRRFSIPEPELPIPQILIPTPPRQQTDNDQTQKQQTQSSQPVAQTRTNIFETLKTKVSSLDDNTKKLGALGVVAVAAAAAMVGIMKNQASNSPQVKPPPSPTTPNSPGKNPEVNLGSAEIKENTEVVPKTESTPPKPQDSSINPDPRSSKLNKPVPSEGGGQVNRGASQPIAGDANKITFSDIFKSKDQKAYLENIVSKRGSDGYNYLRDNAEEIAEGGNVGGAALKDSGLSVFNGGEKGGNLQEVADALTKGETLNQQQQGMIDKTLKALQQANGGGEPPTLNTSAEKIEAIQNLQKAIGEKTDGHYQQIIGQSKVLGISVVVEPDGTLPKGIAGTPPPGAKFLTTAEMQANAAAVSHAPSGGGGFADAWNHVGQAMGAFAAVGGALTLMNWKHNHVLQNANAMLRTGAGIAGAVGASTPLGILAGAADVAYNMTNAALVSTTKGRGAARQAYQDAKEQNNALKIGLGALRVVGSEVAYHKANALNLDKNRQRMTAAIETTKAVAATQWNNVTQTVSNAATKTQELQRTTGAKVAQYCETSKQTLEATCAKVRDNVMALLTFGRGARQALA